MSSVQLLLMAPPVEGSHRRSQRLLAEAKEAANDHVTELQRALILVSGIAADVAGGGDVYPVGVRDLAAKIAGDAGWCSQTVQSIMRNVGRTLTLEEAHA